MVFLLNIYSNISIIRRKQDDKKTVSSLISDESYFCLQIYGRLGRCVILILLANHQDKSIPKKVRLFRLKCIKRIVNI